MLVNLFSDINTESVLKAFSSRSSISLEEFYDAPFFNNVTESNYSGNKLIITIRSLLNVGYLEPLDGFSPPRWKITSAGWDHLHFLELPELKDLEEVNNAKNITSVQTSKTSFEKPVSLKKIFHFVLTYLLPRAGTDRHQNNAL